MKSSAMLKTTVFMLVLGLFLSMPVLTFSQEVIDIQVSPSTLNLQFNGEVVTVHTNIAYSLVDAETVSMNGVVIDSWKADNQGNFVAKFVMEEIIGLPGLVVGDFNTLTLEGTKTDGTTFIGSDEVIVIDVAAKGKR